LLTDFKKNTLYEFETLLHCFNDRSLYYHIVRALNVLLWLVRRREDALSTYQLRYQLHSVEGRAKCPTPTVPQRRELVIGARASGQDSK